MGRGWLVSVFSFVLIVTWLLAAPLTRAAPSEANPDAERFIQTQIALGQVADLEQRFGSVADRRISGAFFNDLLTNADRPAAQRRSIQISHAVIASAVDVAYLDVVAGVTCSECVFDAPVNLTGAQVKRALSLDGSTFFGDADFSNLHAFSVMTLDNATFEGTVTFRGAALDDQLNLSGATFATPNATLTFQQAHAKRDVVLDGDRFSGPVSLYGLAVDGNLSIAAATFGNQADFTRSVINGELKLDRSEFDDPQRTTNFNSMSVGTYLWLRDGVRFRGPVDFTGASFGVDVNAAPTTKSQKGITFDKDVVFTHANVKGQLDLDHAIFSKAAQFNAASVGTYLWLRDGVEFHGAADFTDLTVGTNLSGARTEHDSKGIAFFDSASFYGIKVGSDLVLADAAFSGPADFTRADIKGTLQLDRATFKSPTDAVNFNTSTIGTYLFVRSGAFDGPVDFTDMSVGKNALMSDSDFLGNPSTFYALKIGSDLDLSRAIFKGTVNFTRLDTAGQLILDGAQFTKADRTVNFNTSKVGTYLYMRYGTHFFGPVDFTDVTIGANVDASLPSGFQTRTQFDGEVRVEQAKITRSLYLNDTNYGDKVSFRFTTVGGLLTLVGATFKNGAEPANFESMQVGGINLDGATFNGEVTFFETKVADSFAAQQTCFQSTEKPINLGGMKIGDLGTLEGATFFGKVDFTDTSFGRANFHEVHWGLSPGGATDCPRDVASPATSPSAAPDMAMSAITPLPACTQSPHEPEASIEHSAPDGAAQNLFGFTYQMLYAGHCTGPAVSWEQVWSFLQHGQHDETDYVRAETFLKDSGVPAEGDNAYIASQDWLREHTSRLSLAWIGDTLRGLMIGYGRQPTNALKYGVGVVAFFWIGLGIWRWRGGRMMPRKDASAANAGQNPVGWNQMSGVPDRVFLWFPHGLLYALDVFAPVINLKLQDEWRPKSNNLEIAEKVLTLLGWLIVPLGVAGITGLVK